MKKVNNVKIPERKTTSPQFRSKWSKLINSYSLSECQKLKDQIMSKDWMYTMTNPYSVEERYVLVLLNKKLQKTINAY
jgi:hypothetical protein